MLKAELPSRLATFNLLATLSTLQRWESTSGLFKDDPDATLFASNLRRLLEMDPTDVELLQPKEDGVCLFTCICSLPQAALDSLEPVSSVLMNRLPPDADLISSLLAPRHIEESEEDNGFF